MARAEDKGESFISSVRRFIDERKLIDPGAGVVVGVSGGADSVALLAVLRHLAGEPGRKYRLTAAHLNHGLRDDAGADEEFVRRLAERWEIECVSASRDVKAQAVLTGRSTEDAGRMLRYEFLRETAEARGAQYVAVGHHAADNAETVLYHILRGTHLRGLCGIPASRRMAETSVCVVRPLLFARREEIETFCRTQGVLWRVDSTNADTSYRRNFIRHELMPLIRQNLNPRAEEALLRLAEAAAQIEEWAGRVGQAAFEKALRRGEAQTIVLDVRSLVQEPAVVCQYALRCALERLGVPLRTLDAERLGDLASLLDEGSAGAVSLPGDFLARREGHQITIAPARAEQTAAEVVTLSWPGEAELEDGRKVTCRVEPFDAGAFEAHCREHPPGVELLDADQVRGGLLLRARADGDAFVPLGAPGRQTVSDFLTNLKLPMRDRQRVRCICDELGIIYVAPLRIDERVKITPATKRILRLELSGGEA